MKCFSETNDNPLLWAHYTDSHKGICVEYDIRRCLSSKDHRKKLDYLFPVVYSNVPYLDNEHEAVAGYLTGGDEKGWLENSCEVYLNKAKCWNYEREWRIVIHQEEKAALSNDVEKMTDPGILGIEFPFISAVYFGVNCSIETKMQVVFEKRRIKALYGIDIPLYQMRIKNSSYELEKTDFIDSTTREFVYPEYLGEE